MRIFVAPLVVPQILAMSAQTCLEVSKPRFQHGLSVSHLFSYPSSGGFVRKDEIKSTELDWLGLKLPTGSNRTVKNVGNDDEGEENRFALRLMQLGGRWWPSQKFWNRHNKDVVYWYGHHYPPDLDIAYCPNGTVVVLRTWADNSKYISDLPNVPPEKPNEWSKLSLCATMEERCAVLQEFGAEVYSSADECGDIPKTLEEGIEQGKEWMKLLKKMEDRDYAWRWIDEL